jgi:COP9 signalosome complex subunit 4
VLSDDVPLVVSRQLLQSFAQELGKLEPEAQKEIAHYALAQIQPRVVSFEEQVRFAKAIGSRLFSCKLY